MGIFSDIGEEISGFTEDIIEHPAETAAIIAAPSLLGLGILLAPAAASGMSAYEQHKAGKEAKKAGKRKAEAEEAYTEEQVRILTEENERRESEARARASASGLSGASSEIYISALEESGRQDIDWLKTVGASRYEAAISEGESAYSQAQAAMWGSIGNAFSGGMGSFAGFL